MTVKVKPSPCELGTKARNDIDDCGATNSSDQTDHNAGISDDDGDDRHELSGTEKVHVVMKRACSSGCGMF